MRFKRIILLRSAPNRKEDRRERERGRKREKEREEWKKLSGVCFSGQHYGIPGYLV